MSVKESHLLSNIEPLLSILSQPEIQNSLVTALEKVPKLLEQYSTIERKVSFAQSVLNNRKSLEYLFEGLKMDVPLITLK
ncbi:hypothetical protein LIT25_27250 (plasmid) [Bacillus sp. F19]|nr:hypothetical protein LIT25_27250 [Bacillus sp. F19]